MIPWQTLATEKTDEGLLELRQRGKDFLILIDGRVLMNSHARTSEEALSRLALADLAASSSEGPSVLVGGLGMGFTLRAALDASPAAKVTVAELNRVVVDWCKGPLAPTTEGAITDPRVHVHIGDVAALIANAKPGSFDAIILDLYEGPNPASQRRDDPFYSAHALVKQRAALASGGVLAVWSEDPDPGFAKRMTTAGFIVKKHSIGAGGRKHSVYLGKRTR